MSKRSNTQEMRTTRSTTTRTTTRTTRSTTTPSSTMFTLSPSITHSSTICSTHCPSPLLTPSRLTYSTSPSCSSSRIVPPPVPHSFDCHISTSNIGNFVDAPFPPFCPIHIMMLTTPFPFEPHDDPVPFILVPAHNNLLIDNHSLESTTLFHPLGQAFHNTHAFLKTILYSHTSPHEVPSVPFFIDSLFSLFLRSSFFIDHFHLSITSFFLAVFHRVRLPLFFWFQRSCPLDRRLPST